MDHTTYTISITVTQNIEPHKAKNERGFADIQVPAGQKTLAHIVATDEDLTFLTNRTIDSLNYLLPSSPKKI